MLRGQGSHVSIARADTGCPPLQMLHEQAYRVSKLFTLFLRKCPLIQ